LALTFGNELGIAPDGLGLRLAKSRQDRPPLQPLGCLYFADRRPIAAPRPIARRAHHPCSHRIENHVARQLQQVGVLLHQDRLVSSLKDMAGALVDAIEPLGIDAVELTHALGQIRIWRLHQKVVVIRHQAVGVYSPVVAFPDGGNYIKEHLPVSIGEEDRLAPVSAAGQVV